MSFEDIEERNLITKRINNFGVKARTLSRNREMQKQREKMLTRWFTETTISKKLESDLYIKKLIKKR